MLMTLMPMFQGNINKLLKSPHIFLVSQIEKYLNVHFKVLKQVQRARMRFIIS